jgi:acetaldehyde dehydrogenase
MSLDSINVAILGTGNIGSDLMFKLLRQPGNLRLALFAGIDAKSEGLARARTFGVTVSDSGIDAILEAKDIHIVFDATSAKAHILNAPRLSAAERIAIDLTPAACGPYVVPSANLRTCLNEPNVNLITCGGQATIPLVHAISQVTSIAYAEIVSTVASVSAGPGTRQNIDEFTYTTARGLEQIGGARLAKAIIILNPAVPPIFMRNTIYAIVPEEFDERALTRAILDRVTEIQAYVPGYRLKGAPVFDQADTPHGRRRTVTMLLEVAGAGDYLPPYAGNLDIMTASACRVAQVFAEKLIADSQ